ncbi:subtilisin-like protease SBT2.5 [Dioscorea cayenensis subsp. rotundata]|uniref:Subtilisin-like protease SBT2.5 n=1 Tax=Dioscorea cayennensis subsp. rotundata TaxID=55577 RepID=A0AB40AUT8_DIOCR|nr:subtilisin-like protease SBT2.5 [Dioscorea cayenensis subsp. rotundata]
MESKGREVYFVFMNFDPEYERLQKNRSKQGGHELDLYLSTKHDLLLNKLLQPNTYKKMYSLAIVDGFAVQMTKDQAAILQGAKEVRIVEKNQELA